jgi:YggT family protein
MIRMIINLYILVIILDVILSYLPQFRSQQWALMIKKAANFTCRPIRQFLPPDMPFDISPMIVIILLNLLVALW